MLLHNEQKAAERIIARARRHPPGSDPSIEKIRTILAGLTGEVLEIGAGGGSALPYLQSTVRYTALEPNAFLEEEIRAQGRRYGHPTVAVARASTEKMPFSNQMFDAVISIRSLCAPRDIMAALREVKRVLKPGGIFVFVEHVQDSQRGLRRLLQRMSAAVFGCDMHRDITAALEQAGFQELQITRFTASGSGYITQSRIFGVARVG